MTRALKAPGLFLGLKMIRKTKETRKEMSKATLKLILTEDATKHDMKELKRRLNTIPGVNSVSVSGDKVAVDYDTTAANQDMIIDKALKLGFSVNDDELEKHIM